MIKIENFEIKNDGRCFRIDIETDQNKKSGEIEKKMKILGYYPTMYLCLKAIRDKKLLDFVGGSESQKTLDEIKGMLEKHDDFIKEHFDKYVFVCEEIVKKRGSK